MHMKAEQFCWVPLNDIVLSEEASALAADEDILLMDLGNGQFRLLQGQEKFLKLQESGLSHVAALVSEPDDQEKRLSVLVSLLAEGRLHYLDEGAAYREFIEKDHLNVQQLSWRTGRSVATIRRKIRLLNLGEEIYPVLKENDVSEAIAEALLRIPGQQGRMRVLHHILEKGLDSRAADSLVDEVLLRMPVPVQTGRKMKPLMRDYRLYVNAFREIVEQMKDAGLDAQMQISQGKAVTDIRISIPVFTGKKRY